MLLPVALVPGTLLKKVTAVATGHVEIETYMSCNDRVSSSLLIALALVKVRGIYTTCTVSGCCTLICTVAGLGFNVICT